jgi:hypothetical protein
MLLLFNTLHNYLAYRTAMLQGYAATWPSWEIRWAYDGIGDLMAYAGQDPAAAHDDEGPDHTPRNEFDLDHDLAKAVVTVGGQRYGLSGNAAYRRWRMGPSLIDWVTAGPELPEVMEYESLDMVTAGLDLDPGTRRAGLWSVEPLRGLRERWAELRPGWTLEFWGTTAAARNLGTSRPTRFARSAGSSPSGCASTGRCARPCWPEGSARSR